MLECVANFDEDPDEDRASSVILSPGLRYAFNFKNHAQTVVGLAAPIGLTADAPDYGVFFIFHSNISLRAEPKAGCNWIERSFCCRGALAERLFICSRRLIQAPLDLFL